MTVALPTLQVARLLLREYPVIIACDEVGRGAVAGPVAVGVAVLDADVVRHPMPTGLRDSKLVPARRRADVALRAGGWVRAHAVGWAGADEIDTVGIIRALGLAATRAIDRLAGVDVGRAVVLLDGNHDYITPVRAGLVVRTRTKADRDCAGVAAASVIAKVTRDRRMAVLHETWPVYGWAQNKGYASAGHRAAISAHGLSPQHRASWAIGGAATPR